MKSSELFKLLALASAGAFAVSKVIENPHLLGLGHTPEDKANYLIDKLKHNFNLSPQMCDVAKTTVKKYHDTKFENAKTIDAKVS